MDGKSFTTITKCYRRFHLTVTTYLRAHFELAQFSKMCCAEFLFMHLCICWLQSAPELIPKAFQFGILKCQLHTSQYKKSISYRDCEIAEHVTSVLLICHATQCQNTSLKSMEVCYQACSPFSFTERNKILHDPSNYFSS